MTLPDVASITQALERDALEKFGPERLEELRPSLAQMALELHTLQTYSLGFEDEP